MDFLKKLAGLIFTKKKIIGYVAAAIIAAVAAFLGMSTDEVKEAINQGPSIQLPPLAPQVVPPALEKKK